MTRGRNGVSEMVGVRETLVTSETSFISPKVRYLWTWWHQHAESAGLPLRAEFDIIEHKEIIADIFLVEALPSGDFLLRVHGENVISLLGENNRGRLVLGQQSGEPTRGGLHQYYTKVVEHRWCWRCQGDLSHIDKGYIRFESIDCPLSRDGRNVDFIIGVLDRVE